MFRLYVYCVYVDAMDSQRRFQYRTHAVVSNSLAEVREYALKMHAESMSLTWRSAVKVCVACMDKQSRDAGGFNDLIPAYILKYDTTYTEYDKLNWEDHKIGTGFLYHFVPTISFSTVAAEKLKDFNGSSTAVIEIRKSIIEAVYGKVLFGSLPNEEIPVSMSPHEESGPILVVYRKKLGEKYITTCSLVHGEGKKVLLNAPEGGSCDIYDLNAVVHQASHVLVEQKGEQIKVTALYADFPILSGSEMVGDGEQVLSLRLLTHPDPIPDAPKKQSWLSWLLG